MCSASRRHTSHSQPLPKCALAASLNSRVKPSKRAEAAANVLGHRALGAAAAARAHRAPVEIVVPHLRRPAVDGVLCRIARRDADELVQRQLGEFGFADQQPQSIEAHALVSQEVKDQRIARHHRLEVREVIGNRRGLDVHAESFLQLRIVAGTDPHARSVVPRGQHFFTSSFTSLTGAPLHSGAGRDTSLRLKARWLRTVLRANRARGPRAGHRGPRDRWTAAPSPR